MKTALGLLTITAVLAAGNTLPSEKRKIGPLIQQALTPVQVSLQESSAAFYNNETSTSFLYGTVVSEDGFILTKASELDLVRDFYVRVGAKKYRAPKVIASDETWDVALVKIEAEGLKAVEMGKEITLAHGTWVVSNGAAERRYRRPRPGIISANKREIPRGGGVALGVALKEEDGVVTIGEVTEESGAEKAGLKDGDRLLKVGDNEVKSREVILKALKNKKPGDTLALKVKRGREEMSFEVELMARIELFGRKKTRNDQLSGGDMQQSERRTGFPMVVQHETMLTRHEIGGPVFTLDQVFVGMNIAAVNRVEAFAIPVEELPAIFEKLKKDL